MANTIEIVAPGLYATPKAEFIDGRNQVISKMREEIAELEEYMKTINAETEGYAACEKRLERCKKIIKDCEISIYIAKTHMNLQTNARFRGL